MLLELQGGQNNMNILYVIRVHIILSLIYIYQIRKILYPC